MGCRVSTRNVWVLLVCVAVITGAMMSGTAAQDAVTVVQVEVSGNKSINTDTIRNATSLKPGDNYTDEAVDKDRLAIMSLDYFSAVTVHKEDVPGGVKIIYEVTENPKITDVKIVGSGPVAAQGIKDLMKSKPGQVLNANTLHQDIASIGEYYQEFGYIAYVTEDILEGVDPETGVLTVPIMVHTVESVEITGNKKTKQWVFLREMKTKPGDYLNLKTLNNIDMSRIYNLDIVDVENYKPPQIIPGSEVGLVKVVIPVTEKKTGQVSLGFGYSSRQNLVGQARLSETNFRGKGQGLNLLYEQGTRNAVGGNASYEASFYEPWIDSRHTSLSVSAYNKVTYRFASGLFGSSSITQDKSYNERRKGGDMTVSRPINDYTRVYLGGRFENVETDPGLLTGQTNLIRIAQAGDVTSGSLRLVHNTRDFDLDPSGGGYEGLSVQFGTVDGVRFQEDPVVPDKINQLPFNGAFEKGTIDVRRYFSIGGRRANPQEKRTTFAIRLLAGIGGGKLPFYEQFFVGGGESLRGYREDRFWGNKMLLLSVEYRKPIAQAISGVLFVDYGDAWDGNPEFFITQLQQHVNFQGHFGVGVGMRVSTPIGHLRLDYGVGSEGARTHFSMGHAF